ncbi:MAG: ATP-binding cassette domain-containing protein [Paracoccus sp. (in: a-proteobacteria)]|uniref:ATP-binding cassette domain-containing protein n=1 Tax=Paracoccus sp. TaxID=267 RepID=UPI00391DA1C5
MSIAGLNFRGRPRLPEIRAAEAAECGLACMAMVGRYHGHDIDLNGLRQRFSLSLTGATLRNLMQLAEGLSPRPLRVGLGLGFAFFPATRRATEENTVAIASEHTHLIETVRAMPTIRLMAFLSFRQTFSDRALSLVGEILLDGRPASPDLWRAWRGRIGVVAQDDQLLSGSIADNIAFFDPDMEMERVVAAAAAQVHEDVGRMPMQSLSLAARHGLGPVGRPPGGGAPGGGPPRQRVLLARALYRRPQLLLLDEGTANPDQQTEAAVADLIASLPVTRIVIAHRPALIERATRQLRCGGGKVRELPVSAPPVRTPQPADPAR